jgi:transcriptional regulator GlxA family with amidase domain
VDLLLYDAFMALNVRKVDVARYVADCLRREDSPRASELAMRYGVTLSHLSRTFHARHGVMLSEFIKRLQLRRAEMLLRNTKLDTTHVGYRCGFGTRRSFFRAYRRFKGDSPRRASRR